MRRVAITGMGVISPVGNTVEEFWQSLTAGRHGIGPLTKFDTTEYKCKLAAEVKNFDALQYMTKAETLRSDVYAQYAMAAACQAVEQSGVIGTLPQQRVGVYFGSGIGGIDTLLAEHDKLLARGPRRVSPYFVPMMIANMAPGTIAIRFGCKGEVMAGVTACATGTNAIGEAVRIIRHGYADAMIAGGAEAAINVCGVAGFMNMQALSQATDPDAASLPFDRRRAGFVIGEGAAALVLEEYGHAKERGAEILGEICGYGCTCDAYHITAPEPSAAESARAIRDALDEAGYTGDEAVYVNAHGTGTPMNDSAETLAIKKAFGGEKAKELLVSSTKSMTGHMLGAAGAAEAVACVMALRTGIIPPTIGLTEPDPDCDLNYVPLKAVRADVSLAVSDSLGFGGHNACLAFRRA